MTKEETKNLKEEKRNPVIITLWIGLAISLAGIVTIIVSALVLENLYFRIFLAIFVVGVLILFFALILRRIRRKGIEYFAVGAVTAYIGFVVLAFPAIFFTMDVILFAQEYPYYILMGGGLLFIIFGFLIEAYDLNEKVIEFTKRLGRAFKNMWKKIRWKIILSPWNLFAVVGIVIIILGALGIFSFIQIPSYHYYYIGGILISVTVVYHFRQEIAEVFISFGKMIATIARAWGRAFKQIPAMIKKLFLLLYDPERFKRIMRWTWHAIKYVLIRNYVFLFGFGIALFFILKYLSPIDLNWEVEFSLSALVCSIALVKPILDWRDHFGEEIGRTRTFLYKTAQKTRTAVKRRGLIRCAYCNRPNTLHARTCWECGSELPRCLICNQIIERETKITKCSKCDNLFHPDHLKTWLRMNPACPVCKERISKVKTETFSPPLIKEKFDTQIENE